MPARVRPCFLGLPMGDLNAADFCSEAHTRLLRANGSFPHERAFLNGGALPRGGAVEALVIDDHVGIAIDQPGRDDNEKVIADSFAHAAHAYADANLHTSAAKARRGTRAGCVLGAEFVEGSSFLGCERVRRRGLAAAALVLVRARRATRHVLRRLVGCWVHALLYRRVMMSLLSATYLFLGPVADKELVVERLPHSVCEELKLLAVLAPLMATNLEADFPDRIVSSDASPFADGAASAELPKVVQAELWRHRDRRGAYTRVFGHWATRLRLSGLREEADAMEADAFGTAPSPERILIETFDFVEICCGTRSPLSEACRARGLRVGPRIDLAVHGMWDLLNPRVIEWLLFLAERRRVHWWHSGVPCTDFSVARHPVVRTHEAPWGFEPRHPDRAKANSMLSFVGALIMVLIRVGFGSLTHEHPASAHSWAIAFWAWFRRQPGAEIGRFCACRFGAPFKKDTRLARLRADCLRPLDRMCVCTTPHAVTLEGSATKKAAEYLPEFCAAYADAVAQDIRARGTTLGAEEADALGAGTPPFYERLWVNDLLRRLPWRTTARRRMPGDDHINVRELRAALRHVLTEARGRQHLKVLMVLDSRVAMGALGKGRSAASLLNRELRAALPELLGQDLYPGFLFGPSRLNPADAPSRLRSLPMDGPGRAVEDPPPGLPRWARRIMAGDFKEFDELARCPAQSRVTVGWACLVSRLAAANGMPMSPKESPFDSTLGYPGEGPPRETAAGTNRAGLDIRRHRVLTPAVAARRRLLISEFEHWVRLVLGMELRVLLMQPAAAVDRALADYGQALWSARRSLLDFAETINATVDADRALKGMLPRSWDAAWVWRSLTPAANRVPIPERVMLAMVTVACEWGMPQVGLLIAVGFMGLLRVHELRWLRFGSFVTPRRMFSLDSVMFVTIEKPKMRRLGARRSYVRIDDPGIIAFAEAFVEIYPHEAFLFNGTYAQLRAIFLALCAELAVPGGAPHGLTLGSLRPGGATWLYRTTDCTETVRFRGRWASSRMLEIYIQEVGAASVLPRVSADARARIAALADAAPQAIANALAALPSSGSARAP